MVSPVSSDTRSPVWAASRISAWSRRPAQATSRAAVIAAIKEAGYLHIPEGRRDHTTPAEARRLQGLD